MISGYNPSLGYNPLLATHLLKLFVSEGELADDDLILVVCLHHDGRVVVLIKDLVEHTNPLLHEDLTVLISVTQHFCMRISLY